MQALNFGQEMLTMGGVLPVPRDFRMITQFLQRNIEDIEFNRDKGDKEMVKSTKSIKPIKITPRPIRKR
jgi:hypothetical protein